MSFIKGWGQEHQICYNLLSIRHAWGVSSVLHSIFIIYDALCFINLVKNDSLTLD